jgi:hypothetical protein
VAPPPATEGEEPWPLPLPARCLHRSTRSTAHSTQCTATQPTAFTQTIRDATGRLCTLPAQAWHRTVPATPSLSPAARPSPATPRYAQGYESLLALLPWWGWVGLGVIAVLLACFCLICACCVALLRRRPRNTSVESKFDGIEADGVFAGHTNEKCASDAQPYLKDSSTARSSGISSWTDPSVPCVMKSDAPLCSSKLWQAENPAGSYAAPAKFSSTLGSSCRRECEEDRSSSQASRSQPPRHYNGRERSDSVSQRASKGAGHIINTLRDSFGKVRV